MKSGGHAILPALFSPDPVESSLDFVGEHDRDLRKGINSLSEKSAASTEMLPSSGHLVELIQ